MVISCILENKDVRSRVGIKILYDLRNNRKNNPLFFTFATKSEYVNKIERINRYPDEKSVNKCF